MALFDQLPRNAAPRAWFTGTDDNSQGVDLTIPEARPIHMPWYPILAEWGPLEPQVVVGNVAKALYGSEFLNPRSKYGTPAIPFIKDMNARGNMMLLQRVVPAGLDVESATARVALCLELTGPIELKDLDRDQDGFVKSTLNPVTRKRSVAELDTVTQGYRGQWVLVEADKFGTMTKQQVPGVANVTRYPIIEFNATYFGSRGNNLGLSIYAPTTKDRQPINVDLVKEQKAFTYRINFFERANEYSSPSMILDRFGEKDIEFTFKDNVFNGTTPLYVDPFVLDHYRNEDTTGGRVPTYGPFNDIKVYHDELNEVLALLHDAEVAELKKRYPQPQYYRDSVWDELTNSEYSTDDVKHMFNFLSGVDPEGRHYFTYRLANEVTALEQGVMKTILDKDSRVFALGGDDGDVSVENWDLAVRELCNKLGYNHEGVYPLDDMGFYPYKNVYDVGYTMPTKEALLNHLRIRPDTNVALSPYVYVPEVAGRNGAQETHGGPTDKAWNEKQEKFSVVNARMDELQSWADNYPESVIYGTSVCRVVIPFQTGTMVEGSYYGRVPTTLELQRMRSDYMGSGDGRFTSGKGYDEEPNNEVELLRNINLLHVNVDNRESLWKKSAVWFQSKRRHLLFCPAVQTAYRDDTSVLNSDINMQAVCEANYTCFEVWTELTGISRLPDDEFLVLSDTKIANKLRGKFDNRFVITPETRFTQADKLRGYSWETIVHMEMPNMKTVQRTTVAAYRMGGLAAVRGGN